MADTPNLGLPLIAASQAQKHVTHNEALQLLDAAVQLVAINFLTAPPGSPSEGDRYIIQAPATGAWSGKAGQIAVYTSGGWVYIVPSQGWQAYLLSDTTPYRYNGSSWVAEASVTSGTLTDASVNARFNRVGIGNATADASNRLSINSPQVLFNHAGAGMQATLNKNAAGDDAGFIFQDNWSTRALFGLLGSNDFTMKVSPNGSSFYDGIIIDQSSGKVQFPNGMQLPGTASDPASPTNGDVWYNTTDALLRARVAGATVPLGTNEIAGVILPANRYLIASPGVTAVTTTVVGVADRMNLFPYIPPMDMNVSALAINCTTSIASALAKLVVYASDPITGRPTTRITETGTLDLSTTGAKEAAVLLTLLKGKQYWLGIRHSATATVSALQPHSSPDLDIGAVATNMAKTILRTLAFATAAPATWTYNTTEPATTNAPAIWLKGA